MNKLKEKNEKYYGKKTAVSLFVLPKADESAIRAVVGIWITNWGASGFQACGASLVEDDQDVDDEE